MHQCETTTSLILLLLQETDQLDSVKSQTIRQFMSILDSQIDQNTPVFARSSTPTLSPPQLKFLENLPTVMVFSCLQKFIQWLKDGMYDFHTLPFTLKTHLPLEDQEALIQIPAKWKGGKSCYDSQKSLAQAREYVLVHVANSNIGIVHNNESTIPQPICLLCCGGEGVGDRQMLLSSIKPKYQFQYHWC